MVLTGLMAELDLGMCQNRRALVSRRRHWLTVTESCYRVVDVVAAVKT